jgi:hypothetical protein
LCLVSSPSPYGRRTSESHALKRKDEGESLTYPA